MKQKKTANTAEHAKEIKQKKVIKDLREKEHWMKWGLIAALIIILLLLLFIGYATDWMAGLRKDSSVTPVSSTLDSSKQGSGAGESSSTPNGTATQNSTSGTGRSATSDTNRSSTTTNSTTNNSTTTNTTTPNTPATPPDSLLSLYTDSNVGTSINDLVSRANSLGISSSCSDGVLVSECTFSVGDFDITTKNLLGTGLVTSILKNF